LFLFILAVAWQRQAQFLADFRSKIAGRSVIDLAWFIPWIRSIDLGEVFLNLPFAKAGRLQPIIRCAGAALLLLILAYLWRGRRTMRPMQIYLLAYLAVMFAWPFGDNRFWLPVLPLMSAAGLQAVQPYLARRAFRLAAGYLVLYLILFLIAAFYTTRITYSHDFPDTYVDGKSSDDYKQAWSGAPVTTKTAAIIRRYGMP
jgi:hypothetical protein